MKKRNKAKKSQDDDERLLIENDELDDDVDDDDDDIVERQDLAIIVSSKEEEAEEKEEQELDTDTDVSSWNAPKLSKWKHVGFASARAASSVAMSMMGYYLNVFLLEVVGMSAFNVGTVQLIRQGWDAFTDPVVGKLSDETRTSYGRRKPWIWFSCVPGALVWVLLWLRWPSLSGQAAQFAYYAALLLVFSTLATCVNVPYLSMVPDIATDSKTRTWVATLQESLGLGGAALAVAVTAQLVTVAPDLGTGFLMAAGVTAPLLLVLPLLAMACVDERPPPPPSAADERARALRTSGCVGFARWLLSFFANLGRSLLTALRFRPFALLTFASFCVYVAISLFVSNFILFLQFSVDLASHTSTALLTLQVCMFCSFFGWAKLVQLAGKKLSFGVGMACWCGTLLALFLLPTGNAAMLYAIMVLRGAVAAVGYCVPMALLPDVTEMFEQHMDAQRAERRLQQRQEVPTDEVADGGDDDDDANVEAMPEDTTRFEGVLVSVFILFQKISQALALSTGGYVLGAAGYINAEQLGEGESQPDSVAITLRLLVCIVPIPFLLVAILLVSLIPNIERRGDNDVAPPNKFKRHMKALHERICSCVVPTSV
jgi:glycoside/pentoside/hexuronide:cation symporter, GPH family